MGNINTGYSTMAICDTALKRQIQLGYTVSPSCYAGDTVSVKSITPTSGKAGDAMTINGSNFYGVTNLSFNNGAVLKNTDLTVTPTSISITSLPSGITTGVITINTTFRGTTQTPTFTVSAVNANLPWWFTGIDGGIRDLSIGGYSSLNACTTARNTYLSGFSATTATDVGACTQMTVATAQLMETTRLNKPVGGVVPVSPIDVGIKNNTTYTLLAPIPGMPTCMDWSGKNPNCLGNDIGKYLNVIFKLLIGICIALAVIMLIVYGIMYMGEESVFGKVEAKSKMLSAILGLIIALASWALLNTINPALTGAGGLAISSANTMIPLYDRGVNDPVNPATGESVNCKVLTSGPCSVANLTTALGVDTTVATAMSKICSMESGGTNATSGTDYCAGTSPKLSFSFGLFQVNLSAHGDYVGPKCVGLFNKVVTGNDAIAPKYTSGFSCSLKTGNGPGVGTLYDTCKNALLDTNTNLGIAKTLYAKYGMAPWIGDKKACPSAFQ